MTTHELMQLGKEDLVDMVEALRGDLLVAEAQYAALDHDNKRKHVRINELMAKIDRLSKDNAHLSYRLGKSIEKIETAGLQHDS